MIDVFTWNSPNGRKVPILLEELGVDYTLHGVNVAQPARPAEFLAASASGKIPAITDHGTAGGPVSVFESGAILWYLAEKHGQLIPADPAERAAALAWTFWHAAGVPPMFGQLRQFAVLNAERNETAIAHFRREAARAVTTAEARLAERGWFAGDDYSVADIMNWPSLAVLRPIFGPIMGDALEATPAIDAWVAKIGARPAVKAAVAKVAALAG